MERLTYDFCVGGNHCWQIKGADNFLCKDVCIEQGDSGCKECPIKKAFDRLAAYEDTGLEPEEITTSPYGCVFYCNRKCNLNDDFCAEGPGCPYEINAEIAKHLQELAPAEKDGRLVVLPCKVGDTLYIISHGIIEETKVRTFFLGHPSHNVEKRNMRMIRTTNWDISMDEIGKRIFFTREEAEAALKKREETDNECS